MNTMRYTDLRGKLNDYLADFYVDIYEEPICDCCVREESTYLGSRSQKAIGVPAPMRASSAPPVPVARAASSAPSAQAAPRIGSKPRSLKDVAKELEDTFSQHLFRLIDQKGRDEVEVYKQAGLSRQVFSKIRSNADYLPKKNTALALCISLRLSLDETEDLLGKAGYALSKSNLFDMIVRFFIEEKVYDIGVINEALDDHGEHLLIG